MPSLAIGRERWASAYTGRRYLVAGSRQYRDFDSYLIPPATFAALRKKGPLQLAIEAGFDCHIEERGKRLDSAIERASVLAQQGELPQVRLDENGLMILPLKAFTPPAAEVARRAGFDRLPACRSRISCSMSIRGPASATVSPTGDQVVRQTTAMRF